MNSVAEGLRHEIVALLPRLRRFGRGITRHREDADDLVQMAVERALARWDQWQPGTRVDSWMFRIMQNAWIDELRSRQRQHQILVAQAEGEEVASAASDAQIDALAVRKAMAQLGDDQRSVVALVLVEGLSYKEAAQVLDVPIGTLTSRLARARVTLQEILEPNGDNP
jgi:RNA polymerase sigma factor (sigma-70 family)